MPFPPAHPSLLRAIADRGYTEPTAVQAAVLVSEAAKRDLLVSARTGSGKTVAFGLAIAPELMEEALPPPGAPLALVVAPTRELALQVQRELDWLYAPARGRVASCVGGMDIRREHRTLSDGVHIVVGTPGRLCDHLDRGRLDLAALRAVVLDEADEMLDMGFRDELERILQATPAERRTLLFSATIPPEIESLAARYQRDALRIAATAAGEAHVDIDYRAVVIAGREREHAVVNVLRLVDVPTALVFCATREGVYHLHASLLERGFSAVALSGELTQAERLRALQALRDGRARVLVATDVAARGLDLPDCGLVVHADLPHDGQVLVHRSGRTGRAGRKGTCVVLVPVSRRRVAERILRDARVSPTWMAPPTADVIRERDQARLVTELAAMAEEPSEEDLVVARALLAEKGAEAVAAALVRRERNLLPPPEDLPETFAVHARASDPPRPRPRAQNRSVWFRMNVGRDGNADPRWLVPLICRRGRVAKEEIGAIQIEAGETRFEIAEHAAERFEASARRPDRKDPAIRFQLIRR